MRVFMSVQIPTADGNAAIKNNSFPRLMGQFMETHKPEAAYFITVDGDRCAHFYLDMKDVSMMPVLAEPFFMELNAKVTWCPAMNADDVKKGLEALGAMAGARR